MQQKVTNYEISKRLDELGFECDSHCGWLTMEYDERSDRDIITWSLELDPTAGESYKTYDCWDLLIWLFKLKRNTRLDIDKEGFAPLYKKKIETYNHLDPIKWFKYTVDNDPTNALGLAVIKILREREVFS